MRVFHGKTNDAGIAAYLWGRLNSELREKRHESWGTYGLVPIFRGSGFAQVNFTTQNPGWDDFAGENEPDDFGYYAMPRIYDLAVVEIITACGSKVIMTRQNYNPGHESEQPWTVTALSNHSPTVRDYIPLDEQE